MMDKIIEVKNLVKRYRKAKVNAVDDISFSVRRGEFFAFLGPNGAGKTTTISVLTTTLAKTSGKVIISGFDIDKDASKVRQNIGVIFQNPSLDLNLTAEENIRFHAVLYGLYDFRPVFSMMPEVYKKRVIKLSKILGIKKEIFNPVKSFSGGMKRKLEILRSLMHSPKILFLDEPTSGLDPASRKNLWEYLNEIRNTEKTTIFLTTHYLEEAEEADHIAIINKGKIITFGKPTQIKKELIYEYLLVDAKDRNKLTNELKKLKLNFYEERHIEIPLETLKAQDVINSIKTKLDYLDIVNPTLEEAYLGIIEKENNDLIESENEKY
jgi:ABC-2 type transport system ATP-binding protein